MLLVAFASSALSSLLEETFDLRSSFFSAVLVFAAVEAFTSSLLSVLLFSFAETSSFLDFSSFNTSFAFLTLDLPFH